VSDIKRKNKSKISRKKADNIGKSRTISAQKLSILSEAINANIDNSGENIVKLPLSIKDRDICRLFGIDNIAAAIIDGQTYSEIANALGISPGNLASFIANLDPDERGVIDRAFQQSAEVIMDKAGAMVDRPFTRIINNIEVSADIPAAEVTWRALKHKHLSMRAGQRNARYREKPPADNIGDNTAAPVPSFRIQVSVSQPSPHMGRILDAGIVVDGGVIHDNNASSRDARLVSGTVPPEIARGVGRPRKGDAEEPPDDRSDAETPE
jgi:hypothetical protein